MRENNRPENCARDAWRSLPVGAREVFLWNTHRLFRTGMLEDVVKLYVIMGQGNGCGGSEHNRTFMSMAKDLRDRMLATFRGTPGGLPDWRTTEDPACEFPSNLVGKCPHEPFDYQIETHFGDPRGQIQFFGPSTSVGIVRTYYGGVPPRACSSERLWVPRDQVCDGTCYADTFRVECDSQYYKDRIISDSAAPYTRAGKTIADEFSFEMDQDYNWQDGLIPRIHHSAPLCNNMKNTYSFRYLDPGWNWEPAACVDQEPAVRESGFSIESITASTPIRDVITLELRERINALRLQLGLTAFTWTDAAIIAGVTPVKAVHLTEMRAALSETYGAAERGAPVFTDQHIVRGATTIKAVHVTELRTAIVELERYMNRRD